VFHGHDHFYAKQELDGIIYQEVPQPGYPGNGKPPRSAAEYGYKNGTLLGSSGHLRVAVGSNKVTVEYLRSTAPQPERAGDEHPQVADSYSIQAR
jgi:hypothetical protein